jgi:hypothetical protein
MFTSSNNKFIPPILHSEPARWNIDIDIKYNIKLPSSVIHHSNCSCLVLLKDMNMYDSPNIIRMMKSTRMRWAGHVARIGATRNAYRILVGKPEEKRPLERSRRRWVDNIKMDLGEIRWDGVDWAELAQDRDQWRALVNRVMNLLKIAGNFLNGCTIGSFSGRAQLRTQVSK